MRAVVLAAALCLSACATVPAEAASPSFSIDPAQTSEGGLLRFPIRKHGSKSIHGSLVTFSVRAATAKAPGDYRDVRVTVQFGPNDYLKYSEVQTVDDGAVEPTETVTGVLTAGANARLYKGTAPGTILDNDVPPPPPPPVVACPAGTVLSAEGHCVAPPPVVVPPVLQTCADGSQIPATSTCPPVGPPPAPQTRLCPDGSNIPITQQCPVPPPPPPPVTNPMPNPDGSSEASPSLRGAVDIASNFDVNAALQKTWGDGSIPGTARPDVVGAFRFICSPGVLGRFDPIIYPGRDDAGHLHETTGNNRLSGRATYASLRAEGGSFCNLVLANGKIVEVAVNRSGYWVSALLNTRLGKVERADFWAMYYKRRSKSDPKCSLSSGDPQAEGNCVRLPNGLKQIVGNLPSGLSGPVGLRTDGGRQVHWSCSGGGAVEGSFANLRDAVRISPVCPQLAQILEFANCWNGRQLDSADHMSHLAYADYSRGFLACPKTHPYVIPVLSEKVFYSPDPVDWRPGPDGCPNYRLASDNAGDICGSRIHGDYFPAWDPNSGDAWEENDLEKVLNASGGDLGNGMQLRGASDAYYLDKATGTYRTNGNVNPNPYEDIPPMAGM